VYDPTTGGCCDGLHLERVNQNQGAESTLAFLLSLLEMQSMNKINLLMAGIELGDKKEIMQ
jgi:hypothetical protein